MCVCVCVSQGGSACHIALNLTDIYPMEASLIHPSVTFFHPLLFALCPSLPLCLLLQTDSYEQTLHTKCYRKHTRTLDTQRLAVA